MCNPMQLVPQANVTTDIYSLPTRDWVRRLPAIPHTQPSISDIFARTSAYPQSRNLGTGHPKLFCTACGEYDHWRKDCPYNCHCDNCDSDSHATHMCRAPPKPSPTPSPQPVICVYCGSSDHRSMECRNCPRDNREEGHVPSPASSGYSRDKQCKLAPASSDSSQKSNVRSRNSVKLQRPETGRQQQQQPQRPHTGQTK